MINKLIQTGDLCVFSFFYFLTVSGNHLYPVTVWLAVRGQRAPTAASWQTMTAPHPVRAAAAPRPTSATPAPPDRSWARRCAPRPPSLSPPPPPFSAPFLASPSPPPHQQRPPRQWHPPCRPPLQHLQQEQQRRQQQQQQQRQRWQRRLPSHSQALQRWRTSPRVATALCWPSSRTWGVTSGPPTPATGPPQRDSNAASFMPGFLCASVWWNASAVPGLDATAERWPGIGAVTRAMAVNHHDPSIS